jgi:hypothetical protein
MLRLKISKQFIEGTWELASNKLGKLLKVSFKVWYKFKVSYFKNKTSQVMGMFQACVHMEAVSKYLGNLFC